jgi:hypothetical protein
VRQCLHKVDDEQAGTPEGCSVSVICACWFACAPISAPSSGSRDGVNSPFAFSATSVQHLPIGWSKWWKQCQPEAS